MGTRLLLLATVTVLVSVAAFLGGCGSKNVDSTTTTVASSTSAPFDRAFIDAMVPHHRSAIEMAKVAQQTGLSSPALNGIALSIIDTQQVELDRMLAWRLTWYGSRKVDPRAGEQLGMSEAEMGNHTNMNDLRGGNVDAMFASMMTDHHEGAIRMARMALERGQHPEIKQLARQIIAAQEREVKIMRPLATSSSDHTTTGMSTG